MYLRLLFAALTSPPWLTTYQLFTNMSDRRFELGVGADARSRLFEMPRQARGMFAALTKLPEVEVDFPSSCFFFLPVALAQRKEAFVPSISRNVQALSIQRGHGVCIVETIISWDQDHWRGP